MSSNALSLETTKKRSPLKWALLLVINGVIFYFLHRWFTQNIDLGALRQAFTLIPLSAVMVALIGGILLLLAYGWRVSLLLQHPLRPATEITVYSFGLNILLPFRLGDIASLYYARRHYGVSASQLLVIKVIEKSLDLATVGIIGACVIIMGLEAVHKDSLATVTILVTCALIGGATVFIANHQEWRIMQWLMNPPIISSLITHFLETLLRPNKIQIFLVTLMVWLLSIAIVRGFFMLALPAGSVSWLDAATLTFLTTFSLGIPSSPGAIGVLEAVIVFYVTKFMQVDAEVALASALCFHLCMSSPHLLLTGIIALKNAYR